MKDEVFGYSVARHGLHQSDVVRPRQPPKNLENWGAISPDHDVIFREGTLGQFSRYVSLEGIGLEISNLHKADRFRRFLVCKCFSGRLGPTDELNDFSQCRSRELHGIRDRVSEEVEKNGLG